MLYLRFRKKYMENEKKNIVNQEESRARYLMRSHSDCEMIVTSLFCRLINRHVQRKLIIKTAFETVLLAFRCKSIT